MSKPLEIAPESIFTKIISSIKKENDLLHIFIGHSILGDLIQCFLGLKSIENLDKDKYNILFNYKMKDLGVFTNYNSDSDSSSDSELEEAKYNLSWYDYHHYDLFNYDSLFYAIKCFYCLLKSKIKDNKKLLKQYNNLISKFILNKNNYKSKLLHLLLDKKDIDLIFTFEFDFEEKYYFLMHNLYNDTEEYYKNYIEYSDIFINYINDIILNLTKKNIEFITDKYNYDIVISSITRLGKYVC